MIPYSLKNKSFSFHYPNRLLFLSNKGKILRKNSIGIVFITAAGSTAAAAAYAAEQGDKTIAAVAAPGAAGLYGLEVLKACFRGTLYHRCRRFRWYYRQTDRQDLRKYKHQILRQPQRCLKINKIYSLKTKGVQA